MADLFLLLVYVGGGAAWSERHGFWKSLVWPYHLGKHLAGAALPAVAKAKEQRP
jgi:hypothetical protein